MFSLKFLQLFFFLKRSVLERFSQFLDQGLVLPFPEVHSDFRQVCLGRIVRLGPEVVEVLSSEHPLLFLKNVETIKFKIRE